MKMNKGINNLSIIFWIQKEFIKDFHWGNNNNYFIQF